MSAIRGNTDFEYDLAVRQGNTRRLRTLIKHKVKPPNGMMLFALVRKHPEILDVLKKAGANPNDADGFNETALGHAINHYPVEIVEKLLKIGADPNKESLHLLPLVHAASDSKIEYTRALLKHGAGPNRIQWNGLLPLLPAVRDNEIETVKLLLKAGANPLLKGPDGKTAVELAKATERIELVKLLKSHVK